MCRLSWNLGASTSWNPQGMSRPVMGLFYLVGNEIQKARALAETQFVYCSYYCDTKLLICYTDLIKENPDWGHFPGTLRNTVTGLFERFFTSIKGISVQFLTRKHYSEINSSAGAVRRFLKEANLPDCRPCCSVTVCAAITQYNDGRHLLISKNLVFSFTSDNRELSCT